MGLRLFTITNTRHVSNTYLSICMHTQHKISIYIYVYMTHTPTNVQCERESERASYLLSLACWVIAQLPRQGRDKRAKQVGKDGSDDEAQTSLAAIVQPLDIWGLKAIGASGCVRIRKMVLILLGFPLQASGWD